MVPPSMRHIFRALSLGCACFVLVAAGCKGDDCARSTEPSPDLTVHYEVSPTVSANTIQIVMTVNNPHDGHCLDVQLPIVFGKAGQPPEEPLFRRITFGAIEGGSMHDPSEPTTRQFTFDPEADSVSISYTVEQAYTEEEIDSFKIFYPTFNSRFWYFSTGICGHNPRRIQGPR